MSLLCHIISLHVYESTYLGVFWTTKDPINLIQRKMFYASVGLLAIVELFSSHNVLPSYFVSWICHRRQMSKPADFDGAAHRKVHI
jgi:uncharacterized membrane protein